MQDQSVPARWRLLGIMNGFFINGKAFYGSNEWLMEQLQCSEQTVSNAMSELETLGEVVIQRTRRSRLVRRNLRDPNQLGSETLTDYSRDPNQLGTNSVINSDTNSGEQSSQEIVAVSEDERPPKEKKTTTKEALQVLSLFEKKLRVDITGWGVDKTQRQSITNLLTRSKGKLDLIESALDFVVDYRDELEYFPQILSPYDLDKKWNQLKAKKAKIS